MPSVQRWHSAKYALPSAYYVALGTEPLCREPTDDTRQRLTAVSFGTAADGHLPRAPLPSVWHSTKLSLPSIVLCRVFSSRQSTVCRVPNFTECGTRQSFLCRVPDKRHSAKKPTLGKASDSGSGCFFHHATTFMSTCDVWCFNLIPLLSIGSIALDVIVEDSSMISQMMTT